MNQIDTFKGWLHTFLLDFDKEIDADIYLDYLYEILSNYSATSSDDGEIIESIHSILESLLPDVELTVSQEIFKEYCAMLIKKDIMAIDTKSDIDILSKIIRNDKNAIDKNKRTTKIDPRYALDYVRGDDEGDSDDSFSGSEIDAEFSTMKIDRKMKIDDVLDVIDEEKNKIRSNDKEEAIATTRMLINQKYNSDNESDDPDYDPLMSATGKSNRDALDKANQDMRQKLKETSQQKKEKDKQDRVKQKDQQKSRKENEKKRTQKSERRR